MSYLLINPKGAPFGRFSRVMFQGKSHLSVVELPVPMMLDGVRCVAFPDLEPSHMCVMRGHAPQLYAILLDELKRTETCEVSVNERWLDICQRRNLSGMINLVTLADDDEVHVHTLATDRLTPPLRVEAPALYQLGSLLPLDYLTQQIEEQHQARLNAIRNGMDASHPAGLDLRLL